MELTKYKIGELIELTNEKNANGLYGEDDAIGVNIDKIIMPMRGNLEKKDFSNFHLVPPRHFAYNPRGSRKLGIGFNDTEKTFIMSQRDIADTIEDIYGFEISHETISEITDSVLEQLEEWQNRPLKRFYTFLFVDCLYVAIRKDYETKNYAVYVILGYDVDGQKDILGLWLSESESKHQWMQIFDELKNRGVEDVLFLSMDGVSGLEEGAKAIFPHVTVQRCIVHLIRNSIKYVPNKDYKRFTAQLKKVYGAASLKAAESEFERFRQAWSQYPGAVDVWVRNWQHVAQLFSYGSAVRKILYTTNAVESVNSSFRKVTKKGAFPNENALLKLLYLRINELYKKWNRRSQSNWALVRNQLDMDEKIQERIRKYENGGF